MAAAYLGGSILGSGWTWVRLTPTLAAEWLTNTSRPECSPGWVDHLANEMRCGRFSRDSAMVRSTDGKLLDGCHRVRAVVQSGVTIWVRIYTV